MVLDRFARASASIDRVFGESALLQARHQPDVNSRSIADPGRPDQEATGVFDDEALRSVAPARRLQDKGSRDIEANTVSFSCTEAGLAWVPRTDDIVVRLETGEAFGVTYSARDGYGRITLNLKAAI